MKKIVSFLFLCGLLLIGQTAYSATIDLAAPFDSEGDGVIHFGDQSLTDFVDNSCDYPNAATITAYFTITEVPLVGDIFNITMDHYQASYDAGYYNYFNINGTDFDILVDSAYLTGDHDVDMTWVTQTFSGNNSLLVAGSNSITFQVASSGNNQDDFEITNFSLTYNSASPSTIPEPTTMALFGFGMLGVAGVARRKRRV